MPCQTAPAILTVSQTAIAENYNRIKGTSTSATVAPVLKADGYGTGAVQAFQTLRGQGARQFFIATPDEASALRRLDADVDLFVLGGLYHDATEAYLDGRFIPVLNSLDDVSRWATTARKCDLALPAALHFDTGMNRLGLGADETGLLLADRSFLDGIDLKMLLSHFACSDEKDHEMNARQAVQFAKITALFPDIPKSLCNSSGVFRNTGWHHDTLRPGIALYGGNPTPETINPMRRVVDLSVRILQTRCVKAGDTAGYSASHRFQNDTSIATVALGYADGFHRTGSNRATFFWNGQPCPVVGRVSMDLITVDTGKITGQKPQAGDWLEVLGPHQSVDDLAKSLGTIGYEILTSLGKRFDRVYI